MKFNEYGVFNSESSKKYRIQEMVNDHNFPVKVNNYIDIATDTSGGTLLLRSQPFSEFANLGVELNTRGMAGGAHLDIYTSASGLKSGAPVATINIPSGDSDNIVEFAFTWRFVVLEFRGLTTGQIHNLTIHGKY